MNFIDRSLCKLIMTRPYPTVPNPVVREKIMSGYKSMFRSSLRDVRVIAAPRYTGKKTVLKMACNNHIKEGGASKLFYFTEEDNYHSILDQLSCGLLRSDSISISNIVPSQSIIIIDLNDIKTITSSGNMRTALLSMICECSIFDKFKLMIVTEIPQVRDEILSINQGKNIGIAFDAKEQMWNYNEIQQLVENICETMENPPDRDRITSLTELGTIAGSPRIFDYVFSCHNPSDYKNLALLYRKRWDEFF